MPTKTKSLGRDDLLSMSTDEIREFFAEDTVSERIPVEDPAVDIAECWDAFLSRTP
jgi:hypothetical protein